MSPSKLINNDSKSYMDTVAYTKNRILRFEYIFGRGFTSTGGKQTTENLLAIFPPSVLSSTTCPKVLDVGCGLGGHSFLLADHFGAEVTALDVCNNMLDIAKDRRAEQTTKIQNRVKFVHKDALDCDFPENSFDLIYSRDAILHIGEKKKLYSKFLKWLKPGGQLNVTEYMHGSQTQEAEKDWIEFQEYRKFSLLSPDSYATVVNKVGFENVVVHDVTDELLESLKNESINMENKKEDFIREFSAWDYDDLMDGWETKKLAAESGVMSWGLLIAKKPE